MTDRELMQQALEALLSRSMGSESLITALRERLARQEPVECEPQEAVSEDGWCEWVCPKPQGYLMQCCDCGLIHEVESRVAKYEPRPSEVFEVVNDPDLQVQWRMKRRDDITPARQEPEPVAWIYSHGKAKVVSMNYVPGVRATPLYTAPQPAKQPLTDEQISAIDWKQNETLHDFARAIEAAHNITGEKK